jgi:hypothetical protein
MVTLQPDFYIVLAFKANSVGADPAWPSEIGGCSHKLIYSIKTNFFKNNKKTMLI